jgi:enediyne biosynthesis protein E4
VFRNGGERVFRQLRFPPGDPLAQARVARGLAWGDVDEDGWPDLLIAQNNGPASLLRHRGGASGHWFGIRLEGTRGNRDAIGAMAQVKTAGRMLTRWRVSGDGFMGTSTSVLGYGLAGDAKVESVTVRWPGGAHERFGPFEADRVVALKEGSGTAVPAGSL